MEITVNDITSVDKEIVISAQREDLEPNFKEAYKKYRGQINMPGFRPGKVPLKIVRKRFGDEIEREEVNKYVQDVFENEVVPEYDPVGESQMLDLIWEDDELEAKFKIGARPDFELGDLEEVSVDRLVHDVTDEEVQEEIDRQLEQQGNWEVVEEEITEESKVTVDATHLNEEGEPVEEETDEGQVIDLRKEEFAQFKDDLLGHETGDEVDVTLGEGEEADTFRLTIQKVEKLHKAELTDAFAKQQSNEEAKNVDEYKSLVKSRIQDYYDQSADDLFKNDVVDELVDKHDFEVPEVFVNQVENQYVERVKQQSGGELPPSFDEEEYKEEIHDRAVRDAMWFFLNEKLQEKFDDIEIKPEDIDAQLEQQAAQYGVSVDQLRNLFAQNPQQLESLRNNIRENKVFDKLKEVVEVNEIDKETYQQKHDEKVKA
ncbi:trigger factor [Aliifodinibius salicampi]|uniref:Trigger factor n=1 Tax=Fodinibius salicampi TaxID=1920655 RepID=A0ABT3PYB2_9BACT|nr:trigger factor [Fodinibius salicampi]